MKYLTVGEVLFIHHYLVTQTGGSHGVRDLGLLEAAIARPRASSDGADLYEDVFTKAAALFEWIAYNHPFVDGNKRTAITSAVTFLHANGWEINLPPGRLADDVVELVIENPGTPAIAKWFRDNCAPA